MTTIQEKRERLRYLTQDYLPILRQQAKEAQDRFNQSQSNLHKAQNEANKLTIEIAPKASSQPSVSDHALIRYMERGMGFDVEAVRQSMLTETAIQAINAGATAVTIGGLKFKVHQKVVVTVL